MNTSNWIQWPALVTWLTLILLLAVTMNVARARGRYGIRAPATTGNEAFERIFRVQMNTIEYALMFLPALWLAARFWSPLWASVAGGVWLAGRAWYAVGYAREAAGRSPGYKLSLIGLLALLIGSALGWVSTLG